jgi:hypothetical protein
MQSTETVVTTIKTLVALLPDKVAHDLCNEMLEVYEVINEQQHSAVNDLNTNIVRLGHGSTLKRKMFSKADGLRIRNKYLAGGTSHGIGKEEGCSGKTVLRIVRGQYKYNDA